MAKFSGPRLCRPQKPDRYTEKNSQDHFVKKIWGGTAHKKRTNWHESHQWDHGQKPEYQMLSLHETEIEQGRQLDH